MSTSDNHHHELTIKILLFLFIISLAVNTVFIYREYERNVVSRVIDGDTFELKDGRRIRLLGINAPELKACMGEESKKYLTSLVSGKRVELFDTVRDDFGRTLANVFIGNLLVNQNMLKNGMVRFEYITNPYYQQMKNASTEAKNDNRGIYSSTCKNPLPPDDCLIKGNVRNSKKTYHLPSCANYDQVILDTSFGDMWFCTEEEAQHAGFSKASGCVDMRDFVPLAQ